MTNHVHLLITPEQPSGPSRLMQSVGRWYVRYINGAYRRTGTSWEGRFKSALIDSERYLLTCSRYIELNPVRAGKGDGVISAHPLYNALGRTLADRQAAYRVLFNGILKSRNFS